MCTPTSKKASTTVVAPCALHDKLRLARKSPFWFDVTLVIFIDVWKTALVFPGALALYLHGSSIWKNYESPLQLSFGRKAILSMVQLQLIDIYRDLFRTGQKDWTRFAHHVLVTIVCLYTYSLGSDHCVCILNMSFFNEILTPAFSTSAILKMKKKVFSKYHLRALQVAYWGISLVRLPIWLFLVSLLSMDIFIFSFSSKVDDHENLRTDQIEPLLEAVMLASALCLMMLDQIWKGKLGCYMVFINQNLSTRV